MHRKIVKLNEFIELVKKGKAFFNIEIQIENTEMETKILEEFCSVKINKEKYNEAWSIIFDAIAEYFYPKDMTTFFSYYTLDFLINNEINLNDLAHLQLSDEWLQKIYDKDNGCIEALQTIELRKSKNITAS